MKKPGQKFDGKIKILLGTEAYTGNYQEELKIDDRKINEELREQPARFVFWARMAALQRFLYEKKKDELARHTAHVANLYRSDMSKKGERVTEAMLETATRLDVRWCELNEAVHRARLKFDLLMSVRDAFLQRKDLLMSLSANMREEMDTDLHVLKKAEMEQRIARTILDKTKVGKLRVPAESLDV